MTKISKPEYLAKVKQLSKEETERLLSRMGGKLDRRLEKNKLSRDEALAIQLQLEDEQLQEWRKMMHILKKKEEAKKAGKSQSSVESQGWVKSQVPCKSQDSVENQSCIESQSHTKSEYPGKEQGQASQIAESRF